MTGRSRTAVTPLGDALARRRMTAADLARTTRLDESTVSALVHGRRLPHRPTARRVAAALDTTVADLWPDLAPTPLARAVAERGMTAADLAAVIGVGDRSVERWLIGAASPGPVAADRLLQLGLPVPGQPSGAGRVRPLTVSEVLAMPARHDRRWRDRAVCAASDDPDTWWPEPEESDLPARLTCARCPVIAACRDAFLADPWPDQTGIVAGVKASTLILRARQARPAKRGRTAA